MPTPQLGTVLAGRYRIEQVLGQGGMGSVYAATDLTLHRTVAVKMLHPALVNDPELASRFALEGRALAALGHPHIAALIDVRVDCTTPFLVMEHLAGESLRALLLREQRLAPARAVSIARQVLAALGAAHRRGIVHRDIKPANVMLVRSVALPDLAKVVDFGIAKMTDETTRRHLTADGSMIGTPQYMAPEQALGLGVDPRADVYSVGVCLFEALAGFNPFAVPGGVAAILMAVRDAVPPSLDAHVPGLPAGLAAVVARALAKAPATRFGSADEMDAALASIGAPTASALSYPGPARLDDRTLQGPPSFVHAGALLAPHPVRSGTSAKVAIGIVGALVATLGIGAALWLFHPASSTLAVAAPDAAPATTTSAPAAAPPASTLATSSTRSGATKPPAASSNAPAPRPTPSAAPSAPTPAASTCACIAQGAALCRAGEAPLCTCQEINSYALCMKPWTMPATPKTGMMIRFDCSVPNVPRVGGKPGATCTGYTTAEDAQRNPRNDAVKGTYECSFCSKTRVYTGKDGDDCSGVSMRTGAAQVGKLNCSTPRPNVDD